jgi:polyadenylate-binding protein
LSSVAQPELAGKITGMLIEQDKPQVVAMLSSPELLQNKVEECVQLLQEQQTIKTKSEDQEALHPGFMLESASVSTN